MELLLNLAWLFLALPAYWVWRDSTGAPARRKVTSLQCLFALGCMLVVLFPVVSATDDLHAMRAEMEESPSSKRALRQANSDKPPVWMGQTAPALTATAGCLFGNDESWLQQPTVHLFTTATPAIERAGRAPPTPFLA